MISVNHIDIKNWYQKVLHIVVVASLAEDGEFF